jgi:hypothetical protein
MPSIDTAQRAIAEREQLRSQEVEPRERAQVESLSVEQRLQAFLPAGRQH